MECSIGKVLSSLEDLVGQYTQYFGTYIGEQLRLRQACAGSTVLDSRPRSLGFEPHRRHYVVSLSKTQLSLLSTDSNQEDPSDITEKLWTGT